MGRSATTARVAAFVTTTVAATLAIVEFITNGQWTGQSYRVYALMDDATGIDPQMHVSSAGIRVGTIERIGLIRGKARVDIKINGWFALYRDATVIKANAGMLGTRILTIAPGTAGRPRLNDGDRIEVAPETARAEELVGNLKRISADLKRVSAALPRSKRFAGERADVRDAVKKVAVSTRKLSVAVREDREVIHRVLAKVESASVAKRSRLKLTLESARQYSANAREWAANAKANPEAESVQPHGLLADMEQKSVKLDAKLSNLAETAGRLDRGEGKIGRLMNDDRAVDKLTEAVDGVSEYLGRRTRLQLIVGLREEYQFLQGSVKSYIQVRLQPREDKYYAFEIAFDPNGRSTHQQSSVQSTNPNEPREYFEVRTTTTSAPRYTLQFAQRVGPFWGRFGIKESSGGIGLDTLLAGDRLELIQDLYGFGNVVLPHWRLSLNYEFIHRAWLLGGIDDALSPTKRDYFVGIQLRYNDEDLKLLF